MYELRDLHYALLHHGFKDHKHCTEEPDAIQVQQQADPEHWGNKCQKVVWEYIVLDIFITAERVLKGHHTGYKADHQSRVHREL